MAEMGTNESDVKDFETTGLLEKFSLGDNSVTFSASQYIFFVSTDSALS